MKQIILLCVFVCSGLQIYAQETLKLSREEAETMFLENNLLLISENLNIESQKAEVIQARLWPNPSFSVGEVNLWKTTGVEPSPPFFGNFGRDQQIAFEINQLIQTAGKRKKLIALEEVDVSIAEQYFEDLLRNLKLELRTLIIDLQFIQQSIEIHQNLIENVIQLTHAYKNQLDNGYISKTEYIRLKAQQLEIEKEILLLSQTSNEIQKELKVLLRINPTNNIEITNNFFFDNTQSYQSISLEQLIEDAKENHPQFKLALLEQEYSNKLLAYEKAQRFPDLTFGVNYDRNGSTMLDFVGFGVSFDLPLFNRNKGGIKKAHLSIEKAEILKEQTDISIKNEIAFSYETLQKAILFLNKIEPDYEEELDLLLDNYTQNFTIRNVSMLEYFDFMDAYLSNKKIILEAQKEVSQKIEELNYSLGKDL